jgi:hypothetical protein
MFAEHRRAVGYVDYTEAFISRSKPDRVQVRTRENKLGSGAGAV